MKRKANDQIDQSNNEVSENALALCDSTEKGNEDENAGLCGHDIGGSPPVGEDSVRNARSSVRSLIDLHGVAETRSDGDEAHSNIDDQADHQCEYECKGCRPTSGVTLGRPMTVKEAAQELTCSISLVYRLMERGELAYERRGRRRLPIWESVVDFRRRNVVPAKKQGASVPPVAGQRKYKHLFQKDG